MIKTLLLSSFIFGVLQFVAQPCSDTTNKAYQGPLNMTIQQFNKRTARTDKLVLVNFTADWCIVCKRQKPILDEIKVEKKDVCEVLIIDMECNPLIAEYFEVDALPTTQLYKKGYMTFTQKGLLSKTYLLSIIGKNE